MPATLQLRLKKGSDGRVASFALHRTDGTFTVMRQPNAFFPLHDLTHYAVESVLRHRRGFYGLVCEGWDFADFGSPWPRGPHPGNMDPSEFLVGLLDLERATGFALTVDVANEQLREYALAHPGTAAPSLTPEQLDTIRARLRDYAARWQLLPPGETLVLAFEPGEDLHA